MSRAEIKLAFRAILDTVAELPQDRAWGSVPFIPDVTRPHVVDEFMPRVSGLVSFPADHGVVQSEGLYFVTIYGLTGEGEAPIDAMVDAVLAALPPGLPIPLDSGDTLHVHPTKGADGGQIVPSDKNKSRCQITINWLHFSHNLIPA